MPYEVTLPPHGGKPSKCTLLTWLVNEGEAVAVGQPLAEVELPQATADVHAEVAGVVAAYAVSPGATVAPGDVVAVIAIAGESDAQLRADARKRYGVPTKPSVPPKRPWLARLLRLRS